MDAPFGILGGMSEIAGLLETRCTDGGETADVEALAAALLADPALVMRELEDPGRRIADATLTFGRLETETANAFSRYPAVRGAGFHSGNADPRTYALFGTVEAVRTAGFYTPSELAELRKQGTVSERWRATESLRIEALAWVIRSLIDALDTQRMTPGEYLAAVADAARRLGRLSVGSAGAEAEHAP